MTRTFSRCSFARRAERKWMHWYGSLDAGPLNNFAVRGVFSEGDDRCGARYSCAGCLSHLRLVSFSDSSDQSTIARKIIV